MPPRPQHVVTTVDLPSGKTLEVVHPESGDPFTRVRPIPADDRDLCICVACACKLAEPIAWESAGVERWRVALRCPNCSHTSEGVFSQECVDRFDEQLDDGTAALVSDLKRLERANLADEAERFIGALRAGAILPEDFKAPETGTFFE
jgi:hypothetical protein